ncbi:MAG TPA: hypothetical protein VFX92_11165 [Candidatus Krumholzibacteria bacterium]|nr:hypothetical protein [Candidatus Krumholzibacteria bacterium]
MKRPSLFRCLLAAIAVTALPHGTFASELRAGDRVRVFTSGDAGVLPMVTGTVVSIDDENLVVETGHAAGNPRTNDARDIQTSTIPLSAITSVDRSLGEEHHTGIGALIGGATGAMVGLIVWNVDTSGSTETNDFGRALEQTTEAAAAPGYVLLFGGIGAIVGGVIGHASGSEQWTRVDGVTVGIIPTGSAAGTLTVSLNFGF